jgi:radical SAM superfamily enzyme YgiQ (UPF0313 family)
LNILMLYPKYPDTFWSFKHALKFISKNAAFPPLGLLTVAAMLPRDWTKRVVDMNVSPLKDSDLRAADYVFISAMAVQRESVEEVIIRCKKVGVKMVAGGPLFTANHEDFPDIDHLVLNEAEITLPLFLKDLQNGCARPIYSTSEWPEITKTPIPAWELLNIKKYSSLCVQYSRGCPFDCEFCDIVTLNGRRPRTKNAEQLINELEAIYKLGWREGVFIVDDNFIGNKKKLKEEILPAVISWMKDKKYPFSLLTEASINLADDEDLMLKMSQAGFDTVFVGIESPSEKSLVECGKLQNEKRDMIASVKKMQNYGFQVHGGFIVGFDSDISDIFDSMINFIQRSGIVTAMVGLLNAPTGTRLYKRLKDEKRLVRKFSGNNTDTSMNFIPKMEYETLMTGYKRIITTIYSPNKYYDRIKTFLHEYTPVTTPKVSVSKQQLMAFFRSLWILGVKESGRSYYWRLLIWTVFKKPRGLVMSVTLAIYGLHFRKVAENIG